MLLAAGCHGEQSRYLWTLRRVRKATLGQRKGHTLDGMVERVVDSQVPGSECVSMHVCVRICVHVHVHVRVCVCACVCVGNVKCGAEVRVEWSLEEGSKLFIHSITTLPSLNLPGKTSALEVNVRQNLISCWNTHSLQGILYQPSPLLH